MAKLKTRKYIVTDIKAEKLFPGERKWAGRPSGGGQAMPTHVMWLDGDVVPGAFVSECVWIWPECASEKPAAQAHTHDFTETITFFGTDFSNPQDLCGEVELWLDGEKHIMTKSFLAYIPAGMTHCPLIVRKVERPIFHFTVGLGGEYIRGVKE
ncbi:MAG: hypothetical protein A2Y58_04595 [Chloroflexi bacterium RBG_13_51_52]|nr:MAG: hypothetical protein A2Y58_04595 [Chloroflexi bacterium RBG_13_51_52]